MSKAAITSLKCKLHSIHGRKHQQGATGYISRDIFAPMCKPRITQDNRSLMIECFATLHDNTHNSHIEGLDGKLWKDSLVVQSIPLCG